MNDSTIIRKPGTLADIPPMPPWTELARPFDAHEPRSYSMAKRTAYIKTSPPGSSATWPCNSEGCKEPRSVLPSGKVRAYCLKHMNEYMMEYKRKKRAEK